MAGRLHLVAADAEDLAVLSTHLQDAVIKVGDLAFLPGARRFALVANRFMWERAGRLPPFYRVRTGVHFDGVLKVQTQNIRRDAPDAVLDLLALEWAAGEDGAGIATLRFAGGGAIRLSLECLAAEMSDLTDAWTTRAKPRHDDA